MNIVIIGANSAIAKATARLYAEEGAGLFLIGRDGDRLQQLAADLRVRGASAVHNLQLDLAETGRHARALEQAAEALPRIDAVLICYGDLPDQDQVALDSEAAQDALTVNGTSQVSLLSAAARTLAAQAEASQSDRDANGLSFPAVIAAVTSVAGDRGRQTNYVYGAAKALVSTYLQGLRGRMLPYNVHVVDIRPGLVDSPMTAHLEKGPLWSSPQQVARCIQRGIAKRRYTVYAPGYWRLIMFIIRCIPESLFKRLKI